MKKTAFLIILLTLTTITASAKYKAVLVMLRGESNKINYYLKTGQTATAADARTEAEKVMKVTIKDFTDNFTYCPVYYFIDSNLTLIKEKKFNGIILDKNLKAVSPSSISSSDTNFVIVYYGVPSPEIVPDKDDGGGPVYKAVNYPGDGLVVLTHEFKRRDRSSPSFIYKPQLLNSNAKQYTYISKRFDMGYRPFAKHLQDAFH